MAEASCIIERENVCPGPELEPGPLALRASALTKNFNITSLNVRNIKHPFINGHSRVCECMPA